MITATLRTVGGSVMVAIPPAILDLVSLSSGSKVELRVEAGRLVIAPVSTPQYTLAELLAQCDEAALAITDEDRAWLDDGPVGKEAL